jgi:long-subunit fatty acid transport protein
MRDARLAIAIAIGIAAARGEARAGVEYSTDLDAVALGQGGAFIAAPDTLAAVWYNPAGLALGHGWRFELEGGLIHSPLTYDRTPGPTGQPYPQVENRTPFLPAGLAGASYDFGRRGLAAGLFAYVPSSSHYEYDPNGAQRFAAVGGSYALVFVHAAAAIELPGHVSIGLALGPTFFHARQENVVSAAPDFAGPETKSWAVPITIRVDARPFLTGTLGASFRPRPWLAIGASVMPRFDIHTHGTASFELPPSLQTLATVQGNTLDATLHFPTIARLGVRVSPRPDLEVELAGVYEGWSRFRSIDLEPQIRVSVPALGVDMAIPTIQLIKNYRDVYSVRAGGELVLRPWLRVRAGAFFESAGSSTAYFDITAPEANKVGVSLGATARLSRRLFLDVALAHTYAPEVDVNDSQLTVRDVVSPTNTTTVGNGVYRFDLDFAHVGLRMEL